MHKQLWFIVFDYVLERPKKLVNWVDADKVDWVLLSRNPNAVRLNLDNVDWRWLS